LIPSQNLSVAREDKKNSLSNVGFLILVARIELTPSVTSPERSAPPLMQLTIIGMFRCLSSGFFCLKDVMMLLATSKT
jgi:hypothetical protein